MTNLLCSLNVELPCPGLFKIETVKLDHSDASIMIKFHIEWIGFSLGISGTFRFDRFLNFSNDIRKGNAVCTLNDEDGGIIFTVARDDPNKLHLGLESEIVLPYQLDRSGGVLEPSGSRIIITPNIYVLDIDGFVCFIEEIVEHIDVIDETSRNNIK